MANIVLKKLFVLFLQKNEVPELFTCIEFSPNGDVITGDSNGSITVWGKGINLILQVNDLGTTFIHSYLLRQWCCME